MVGAFAMAVAIAVGATTFAVISAVLDPALPFAGGGRVVALKFVGTEPAASGAAGDPPVRRPSRPTRHGGALRRVSRCGAQPGGVRDSARTGVGCRDHRLGVRDRRNAGIAGALSAACRRIRIRRRPSSSSVMTRGRCALAVIRTSWDGRSASAGVPRTIVGVMPRGFKFPVRSPVLGSTARESAEVPAWGRAATLHVRPPRAWRHVRSGTGGIRRRCDSARRTRAPRVGASFGRWSFRTRAGSSTRR